MRVACHLLLTTPSLMGLYTKTEEIMNGAPVWKGLESANGKFVYLSTASGSYGSWVIAESDDRSTWKNPSGSWVRRSRESGTWLQPANDTAVDTAVRVAVSCGTGSSAQRTVLRCECLTITQNDENRSLVLYDAQRGCSAGAHILHNPVFFVRRSAATLSTESRPPSLSSPLLPAPTRSPRSLEVTIPALRFLQCLCASS